MKLYTEALIEYLTQCDKNKWTLGYSNNVAAIIDSVFAKKAS